MGDPNPYWSELKTQFERFYRLLLLIVFDVAVFGCAIFAFGIIVFFAELLFDEDTPEVVAAKIVSFISVIGGYAFYSVFDLGLYIKKSLKKSGNSDREIEGRKREE